MPRLSVMGHPVHPIFQAIPAAVLPASTTFDALAYLSGNEGLSEAGRYSLIFGLLGGVGAAATGILDYYEIKNRPVRRIALYHGLSNVALMASYSASLVRRRGGPADASSAAGAVPLTERPCSSPPSVPPSSGSPDTLAASWCTSTA